MGLPGESRRPGLGMRHPRGRSSSVTRKATSMQWTLRPGSRSGSIRPSRKSCRRHTAATTRSWSPPMTLTSMPCIRRPARSSGSIRRDDRVNASPAVVGGKTFLTGCDGMFRIIDIQTGEEDSFVDMQDYVAASPAVVGGSAYVWNIRLRGAQDRLGRRTSGLALQPSSDRLRVLRLRRSCGTVSS